MQEHRNQETKTSLDLGFEGELHQATLSQALETFIRLDMVGKSRATRRWYEKRLGAFVAELGAGCNLASIMEIDILEYIAGLAGRTTLYGGTSTRPEESGSLSPHTIAGHVRALRRFFRWLYEHDFTTANPAAGVKVPKVPDIGEKGISDKDARAILEAALRNTRDYAMIRFVEATGCRLGGLVGLQLNDINLEAKDPQIRRQAQVREKGEKERTVFLTDEAASALREWLKERPVGSGYKHVFLGASPGQPYHPLKEDGAYTVFRKWARIAGVEENWSPHQWRHRFGRRMAQKGMNLGILAQIMGHSSVQVTVKYYGKFAVKALQKAYDEYQK